MNTTSQLMDTVTYEYDIRPYNSNVEVYVRELGQDGELLYSGRVASVECTGDSPQYSCDEDWENDENAMTNGYELSIFLSTLSQEELREWLGLEDVKS